MINQEEYEILKKCDDEFKWVARDKNRKLWAYTKKPDKGVHSWGRVVNADFLPRHSKDLFQFIQWEDEEPHSIAELIEEYDKNQPYEIIESEEKEVKKNKEWAQKEVDRYLSYEGVNEARNALVFAKGVIDQIDEPEVKQIKELDSYNDELIRDNNQLRNALDELEVLSQELPVIPKYVADWIEKVKPDNSLKVAFEYIAQRKRDNHDDELAFWVEEGNSETFARAWLDGYKIEEEPKFYVLDKEDRPLLLRYVQGITSAPSGLSPIDEIVKNQRNSLQFTEQEIKDYDERYWPFAVPVEDEEDER